MAQPFDSRTLELTGEPRMLAPDVNTVPAAGSVVLMGDFAAGGGTIAYRTGPASMLKQVLDVKPMMQRQAAASSSDITVLRDWM
jgi:endonuclease/exonuclease/phosphatase family metal-dependent hydrolase